MPAIFQKNIVGDLDRNPCFPVWYLQDSRECHTCMGVARQV